MQGRSCDLPTLYGPSTFLSHVFSNTHIFLNTWIPNSCYIQARYFISIMTHTSILT